MTAIDEAINGKEADRLQLAALLQACANVIFRVDGDRDYMNPSDLTVQQTTAAADLLRLAATALGAAP